MYCLCVSSPKVHTPTDTRFIQFYNISPYLPYKRTLDMSELDVRLNIRVLFKNAGTGLVTYHVARPDPSHTLSPSTTNS